MWKNFLFTMWFQDFVTDFNQSYNCQTSHCLGRNRPPNARLSILLFDPCIRLYNRAEILKIITLVFGRNDVFIKKPFRFLLTFATFSILFLLLLNRFIFEFCNNYYWTLSSLIGCFGEFKIHVLQNPWRARECQLNKVPLGCTYLIRVLSTDTGLIRRNAAIF